jgi:hypothetical protein
MGSIEILEATTVIRGGVPAGLSLTRATSSSGVAISKSSEAFQWPTATVLTDFASLTIAGTGNIQWLSPVQPQINVDALTGEVAALKAVVLRQSVEIKALRELIINTMSSHSEEESGIEVLADSRREADMETAKKEIRELFDKTRMLYYSDIAQELNLDLVLVVEACEELVKEGAIEAMPEDAQS